MILASSCKLVLFAVVAILSGCDAFTTLRYKDAEGGTLATVTAKTPAACHMKCTENKDCKTAIYFAQKRRCYLKAVDYTQLTDTNKGYLVALFDGSGYTGYNDAHFVWQPRSTDRGAIRLTGKSIGAKDSVQECQRACFETYKMNCIYVQRNMKDKECFIARDCDGPDCKDVREFWKVGIRNYSRVYCKNAAYQAAWASWKGSYYKGTSPCSRGSVSKSAPKPTPMPAAKTAPKPTPMPADETAPMPAAEPAPKPTPMPAAKTASKPTPMAAPKTAPKPTPMAAPKTAPKPTPMPAAETGPKPNSMPVVEVVIAVETNGDADEAGGSSGMPTASAEPGM